MPRTRPHFKSHISIKHHRKMGRIHADNDLLALWIRLGHLAVERFATKTGDEFRVHRSELPALGGYRRRDKVEESLKILATDLGLTLNLVEGYWVIGWPNFSKKQGFNSKNPTPQRAEKQRAESREEKSASPHPEGEPPSGGRGSRVKRHPEAERLTALCAETLAAAAERHGVSRKTQDAIPKPWLTEIDRLLRVDKVEPGVVEATMLWAINESDFWGTGCGKGVLASAPGLRRNWDKISAQYANSKPRERFDAAKRVLAMSEGGKQNGRQRESSATRLLAEQLDRVRQGGDR